MSNSCSPFPPLFLGHPVPSLEHRPPPPLVSALSLPSFSATPSLTPYLTIASSHTTPLSTPNVVAPISSSPSPAAIRSLPFLPSAPIATFPGCPAIPHKLVKKIVAWEYIDLADLLPEQLRHDSTSSTTANVVILPELACDIQRRKKRQIPDIATWVQVYSIYMLVLSAHHPSSTSELIAYQLLIVQHSKKFEYPSWLQYDIEFRQWAAANQYTKWSQIHPQFYAYAFTARGKATAWCPVCHLDGGNHTYDCPRFTFVQPRFQPGSLPYSSPFHSPSPSSSSFIPRFSPAKPRLPPAKRSKPDHCILFNKNKGLCPYGDDCKFTHKCARCQGGHPVSSCPNKPA